MLDFVKTCNDMSTLFQSYTSVEDGCIILSKCLTSSWQNENTKSFIGACVDDTYMYKDDVGELGDVLKMSSSSASVSHSALHTVQGPGLPLSRNEKERW